MKRRVLPVFLPPETDRASLIDPSPRPPSGDLRGWVRRTVAAVGARARSGRRTQFAFFGGSFGRLPPESARALLKALPPRLGPQDSLRVTLDPPHLGRRLPSLSRQGVATVELDVGSFDDAALAASGLDWTSEEAVAAARKVRRAGLELGLILRPGMPGGAPGEFLTSARRALELCPDFVRIYPVLVLSGSPLHAAWQADRYRALTLEETVSLCRELIVLFTQGGVPIGRIGFQPAVDLEEGLEVVAGPHHPCLRLLAEAELWLERAAALIEAHAIGRGEALTLLVAPRDESRLRGLMSRNLRRLKERFGLSALTVRVEKRLARGALALLLPDGSRAHALAM